MMFFRPEPLAGADPTITLAGATDNRGNSYVVGRMLATKFPLICFLMEMAAQCERSSIFPSLLWVPREENLEADALSNGICSDFSPERRVQLDLGGIPWLILPAALASGEELYGIVRKAKLARSSAHTAGHSRPRGPKRARTARLAAVEPW